MVSPETETWGFPANLFNQFKDSSAANSKRQTMEHPIYEYIMGMYYVLDIENPTYSSDASMIKGGCPPPMWNIQNRSVS